MCVVSMVIDRYTETWPKRYYPYIPPLPYIPPPNVIIGPTKEEIDEFRQLLKRAREYDRRNNEPDCPMDEKKRILKELAKNLGVDISFIDD